MQVILALIVNSVAVFLWFRIFECYLPKKQNIKYIYVILILLIFCLLRYFSVSGEIVPRFIVPLISSTIGLGISLLFFEGKISTKAFLSFLLEFYIMIFRLLLGWIITLKLGGNVSVSFMEVLQAAMTIIYYITLWLVINFMANKRTVVLSGERNFNLLQAVIPLISILFVPYIVSRHIMESCLVSIVFIIINTVQYIIYRLDGKLFDNNTENIHLIKNYKIKDSYYKKIEDWQDEIREIRHDLKNQLSIVGYYLKLEDSESAKKEIGIILGNIDEKYNAVFTRNIPVNVLLNNKYSKIQEKEIKLDLDIKIPEKLNIADGDVVRILGNALDNAIEASEKAEVTERFINLKMYYNNKCLVIQVINNTDGKVKGVETHKKDKSRHGFGLKSIDSLVKKYNGSMEYFIYEDEFKIGITLWG